MLDFFASIGDFLINIVTFVISFFRNVIEICVLVFKGFTYAVTAIAYLPVQYQAVLLAILAFCVIKTILHFGG